MTEGTESYGTPSDKTEGWQPDRMNPNLQRYWDGSAWTATRRSGRAGQWVDEAAVAAAAVPLGAPNRRARRPVRPPAHAGFFLDGRRRRTPGISPTTVSAALGGLFVCSFLLILGSFTPWISVSIDGHGFASVAGTDSGISQLIGVNGWITFSAGIFLFVLACMIVDLRRRPSSGASALLVVALAAAGFAIYDLVRILQKISQAASAASSSEFGRRPSRPTTTVGWGLIVVVVGGVGALLCALSIRQRALEEDRGPRRSAGSPAEPVRPPT